MVSECVVFAVVAAAILAFRRSRHGRRSVAITNSPNACVTLGIDMSRSKLAVFIAAAAIAGLGGALYGGAQAEVGPNNFQFLLSLTLLLLAVTWGVRTTTGMLVGGIVFALAPLLEQHLTSPRDAFDLLVGLAAVGVSQNPEGTFGGHTLLQRWRERQRPGAAGTAGSSVVTPLNEGRLSGVAG
jgi:branched-chain amino acid transport system permease protein